MANYEPSLEDLKTVTLKLLDYCQINNWAGYDPYDALNSKVLKFFPWLDFKLARLALTQFMKRSPLNLRPLLRVPKTQNPKAIALFLMSLLKLLRLGMLEKGDMVGMMVEKLAALRTEDASYRCWGYSFPWQTRTMIVPRGTPNIVCTVFAANALLDAYENRQDPRCLTMAVDAARYILNKLYWAEGDFSAGFSYPLPSVRTRVHNANILGAAFLCRVYRYTGEKTLLVPALEVARNSASKQNADGSWYYGELPDQSWIDNFHTGYILLGLRDINKYGQTTEFNSHIQRGFSFYKKHFFTKDAVPKYFHNHTFPIDIHCIAQSLITLLALSDRDDNYSQLPLSIARWVIDHMWDEQGYFYFQILPSFTNKISYVRWSQAWMLLAFSTLLEALLNGNYSLPPNALFLSPTNNSTK